MPVLKTRMYEWVCDICLTQSAWPPSIDPETAINGLETHLINEHPEHP